MNNTIRNQYQNRLDSAASEEERDLIMRSIYHFGHRGAAVDTTKMTKVELIRYSERALAAQ